MIRRISTKWMLAVSTSVVVPFLVFAFFVRKTMADRLSGEVVQHHLLSLAADLADRVDAEVEERRFDAELLSVTPVLEWFLGSSTDRDILRARVEATFDRMVRRAAIYELVVAIDASGRFAASNGVDSSGRPLPPQTLESLRARDWSRESWFQQTMRAGSALVDHHRSDLLPPRAHGQTPRPEEYRIGFARRVENLHGGNGEEQVGAIFLLVNWKHFQDDISSYGVRRLRRDTLDDEEGAEPGEDMWKDIYASSYAWIWHSDGDTILAHKSPELYEQRVSGPMVGLPQLVTAVLSAEWGMYPDYRFRGEMKQAAFKHCLGPGEGGFGWIVGVGVDDDDILLPVRQLSRQLLAGTALVLSLALLFTWAVARRTTAPILALERHTRRIASGDLDARVDVRREDELGDLARALNRMSAELKEKRAQLVQAEKEAAWREMARQVAHEIKNPLTPISISAGLLKRSRQEGSPEFDAIFERTIDMIQRQVESMRGIAQDFYAFAGEHREPRVLDAAALADEVLELNAAWAEQQGVRFQRGGSGGRVRADPDELRRALINVVSNAIEAMPEGGELCVDVSTYGQEVVIEVRDSGRGIPAEVEGRLFDPYFTTRSSGTGLGLAIVRRVVEDMGGRVELENAAGGQGAIARLYLPGSA